MKAVLCKQYGFPDTLVVEDVPSPLPAAGVVLLLMNVVTIFPFWPGNIGLVQVAIASALVGYGVTYARGVAYGFGLQAIEASVGIGVGLLFLIGGVVAAISEIAVGPTSTLPVIGASGAISAVLGAYLVLFPRARVLSLVFLGCFYQLMLVPQYLRRLVPDARIAFFLHIPFPATDVFRVLPWSRALLRGLLASDLVGFQVQAYAWHFLNSAQRLLGCEVDGVAGIARFEGREVSVQVHPIGVDVEHIERLARGRFQAARQGEISSVSRVGMQAKPVTVSELENSG